MKIATIAPPTYEPGKLEYFQFIRGGVGADYHQGPGFYQFAAGLVRMTWGAHDFDECSRNWAQGRPRPPCLPRGRDGRGRCGRSRRRT